MSRFYRIKINSVYLTSTGLNIGSPVWCETAVAGADSLLMSLNGSTTISADGTPINQTFGSGTKGKTIEIRVTRIYKTVWEQVVAIINNSLENGALINIVGSNSDIGDFDLDFLPLFPKPFEAQEFSNGRIENAVFRFVCAE